MLNENSYKIKRLNRNSPIKMMNRQRMKKCFMRPDYLKNDEQELAPQQSESEQEEAVVEEWIQNNESTNDETENENVSDNNNEKVINPLIQTDNESQTNIETSVEESEKLSSSSSSIISNESENNNKNESSDSINNNYYERRDNRPKRVTKPPDYYNSLKINRQQNEARNKLINNRTREFKSKSNHITTVNKTTNIIHDVNIPTTSNETLAENLEAEISAKKELQRSARKKKPPDK